MEQKNELSILTTYDDKHSYEIERLSNFFDGYIHQLSTQVASYPLSEITDTIQKIDIGIINEALDFAGLLIKGKTTFVPDFDSLPADILRKLKKGIYTLGESRQVEDNFRAVVLDENGVRIKDLTLKKVMNPTEISDSIRTLSEQTQLRQINKKLDAIQELQTYQIDSHRNHSILVPFFDARDNIARAQASTSIEEQNRYLNLAIQKLTTAINSIYTDVRTLKKNIYRLTCFPIFQPTPLIRKYISNVAEDLQMATKFIGLQMQVFNYQNKHELAKLELEKFKVFMTDFACEKIGRGERTLLQLIQGTCALSDVNLWNSMEAEIEPFLMLNETKIDDLYLITAEDSCYAEVKN